MTDYTPSTRRVRAAYVHGVGGSTWYEGKAESLQKDFDRWLAEVKAQEREAERQRIIAILKGVFRNWSPQDMVNLIGTINGESNLVDNPSMEVSSTFSTSQHLGEN